MPKQKIDDLIIFSLLVFLGLFFGFNEIPQPDKYHKFVDHRTFLGIRHFANVASNIAYLIPGIMGLYLVHKNAEKEDKFIDRNEAFIFYVVFLGSLFLAFGSAFYHLNPYNGTLVADRLTMTIGFMGVLSFVIAERISVNWGLKLLPPFLALGLFSVLYWAFTEMKGGPIGDLRLYGLVQFLPLFLIAVIWWDSRPRYQKGKYVWWALGAYVVAKAFEVGDKFVWELTEHIISGHTMKHLISGLAIYFLVLYIKNREPV